MNKKWYKDKSRGELAGVIAGLYDYFNLYENYGWKLENVRLVVIILAIVTNLPFLTAYIILAYFYQTSPNSTKARKRRIQTESSFLYAY